MAWYSEPVMLWIIIIILAIIIFKIFGEIGKAKSEIRSVRVVHGQSWEKFVPFMKNFPYNPRDCIHIGMPVDFVAFDLEHKRIVFVEVKTGKSRLSGKEEKIKRIVDDKRVVYEVFRY